MINKIIFLNNNSQLVYRKINNIIILYKFIDIKCILNKNNINIFCKFLLKTYFLYWTRMVWRGKAYRIRFFKKFKKFTLNFGHSHWTKVLIKYNIYKVYKLKKQNYFFFFEKLNLLNYIINFFSKIKTINKYTKRGIRIKKTPYIRRFGKISQMQSSMYH